MMSEERHKRATWAGVAAALLALLVAIAGSASSSASSGELEAGRQTASTIDTAPAGPVQTISEPSVTAKADTPESGLARAFGPAEDLLEVEPSGPEGVSPPPVGPTGETVLRLVYFVEADQDYDPRAVEAIEEQAEALQDFWFEQFGGTFRLPRNGIDVVYGDQPATWYDQTPNGDDERWYRLMNIRDELLVKLGLPSPTGTTRIITFPHARIDGRVGANRHEGAWMDGDDISCIDDIVETTPYTRDFPANCLSTVAHELGHVYGLGHQGIDEDCMQFGFYHYVNGNDLCEFSPENRTIVIDDPRNADWLDAQPGDRG